MAGADHHIKSSEADVFQMICDALGLTFSSMLVSDAQSLCLYRMIFQGVSLDGLSSDESVTLRTVNALSVYDSLNKTSHAEKAKSMFVEFAESILTADRTTTTKEEEKLALLNGMLWPDDNGGSDKLQ